MNIQLQPYEWKSGDKDGFFSIRIWCHNRNSERVLLRIEDYKPMCRIELPSMVNGRYATWKAPALRVYANWLSYCLKHGNHSPVGITFDNYSKLYYYQGDTTYPFLVCRFESMEARKHCVNLINKRAYDIKQLGSIKATAHEGWTEGLHQMITDIKLGYGQWFSVKANKVQDIDQISVCNEEYIALYQNIEPLPLEDTSSWMTEPVVAAIDLEVYSGNHDKFPEAVYVENVIFQISYITQRIGDISTR